MNKFCESCGTALEPGERFCGNCGKPAGAAPNIPAAPPPPAAAWSPPPPAFQPPPPPNWSPPPPPPVPQAPAASWPGGPPPPPSFQPPPPPANWGAAPPAPPPAASWSAAAAPAPAYSGGPLPPSPAPWEFQKTVAEQGESMVRSMGLAKPGQRMGLIEMMVRGAFLDARVYRQAALDAGGNQNAAIAVGLTFLAAVLGGYLLSLNLPGFSSLIFIVGSVLVQVVAYVVGVGIMAAVSQSILGRKLEFGHIFRAMSYAQSPGVLAFIPMLGQLLGLWRIPTSLVAIREISACEGAKAAILLIIGAVGSTVAAVVLSPAIMAAFAFMR